MIVPDQYSGNRRVAIILIQSPLHPEPLIIIITRMFNISKINFELSIERCNLYSVWKVKVLYYYQDICIRIIFWHSLYGKNKGGINVMHLKSSTFLHNRLKVNNQCRPFSYSVKFFKAVHASIHLHNSRINRFILRHHKVLYRLFNHILVYLPILTFWFICF